MTSYEFFHLTLRVRLFQRRPELGDVTIYEQTLDDEISRVIKILGKSERFSNMGYCEQHWNDIINETES